MSVKSVAAMKKPPEGGFLFRCQRTRSNGDPERSGD